MPEALVAGKPELQLIYFDIGLFAPMSPTDGFFPTHEMQHSIFDNKMLGFSPINCPPTEKNEKMHN